jgi:hypothetical protein
VPTTPSPYLQEGGWSQAKQRREMMFRDQHGRRYHATIEIKSGHPCGPIAPQFQAPLATPMKYLGLSTDPERPYDLNIKYDAWLADLRTDRAEWEAECRKLARALYRDKYDPKDAFTAEVVSVVGAPPQHIEPVLAAKQGNRWVLGLTDRVDVRLFPLLEAERATTKTHEEPDFSEVVEEFDAATDDARAEEKRIAREKKQRQRAKAKPDPELIET